MIAVYGLIERQPATRYVLTEQARAVQAEMLASLKLIVVNFGALPGLAAVPPILRRCPFPRFSRLYG
jgi:hypothetical protein